MTRDEIDNAVALAQRFLRSPRHYGVWHAVGVVRELLRAIEALTRGVSHGE